MLLALCIHTWLFWLEEGMRERCVLQRYGTSSHPPTRRTFETSGIVTVTAASRRMMMASPASWQTRSRGILAQRFATVQNDDRHHQAGRASARAL